MYSINRVLVYLLDFTVSCCQVQIAMLLWFLRCLLDQKALPVMKIIRVIFGLILTFSSQLTSQGWQRDAVTCQLRHLSFTELQRTYSTFHEHSLFLFKGIQRLVTSEICIVHVAN